MALIACCRVVVDLGGAHLYGIGLNPIYSRKEIASKEDIANEIS